MIPQRAHASNLQGITAGLGLPELTIDLTEIPESARTVAVKGDNGRGKSTFFDLMATPFREPPQLPGTLYDECGEGKAVRELWWSHGGTNYHSVININKTKKTETMKAYLHVEGEDGWEPYEMSDGTASNGLSGTYDGCLEEILGSKELYFMTAFRAQNGKSLAEVKKDDAKSLLTDLLRLNETKALAKQAQAVALALRKEGDTYSEQIASVENASELMAEYDGELVIARAAVSPLIDSKVDRVSDVQVATAVLEAAQRAEGDNEKVRKEKEGFEAEIEALNASTVHRRGEVLRRENDAKHDLGEELNALGASHVRTKRGVDEVRRSINEDASAMMDRVTSLTEEIGGLEERKAATAKLRELGLEIVNAEAEVNRLDAAIGEKEEAREAARESIERVRALVRSEGEQEGCMKILDTQLLGLNREINGLVQRATYVGQVPCAATTEPYRGCPALQDAMQAQRSIGPKEEERSSKGDEHGHCEEIMSELAHSISAFGDVEGAATELSIALNELRANRETAQAVASRRGEFEQAETTLEAITRDIAARTADIDTETARSLEACKALEKKIDELEAEGLREEASSEARKVVLRERVAAIGRELTAEDESLKSSVARVQEKIDALPPVGAADALRAATEALATAEGSKAEAERAVERANTSVANLEADRERLETQAADAPRIAKLKAAIEEEVSRWQLLAIGLKGTIDLCIEDAGPSISRTANQLLRETFGPRFTLRIVTQQKNATNGILKEVFQISVLDSESGLESPMSQKSGGEQVWISQALAEAVAIYHHEVSGEHYEATFADEAEDGLTQERKALYYQMQRKALELGGYSLKIFISHDPTAWAEADYVIDMDAMAVAS